MLPGAEERLLRRGLTIVDSEFGRSDEPDVLGVIGIQPADGGHTVHLIARPAITPDARAVLAQWFESRLDRFLEHGPQPDGWQRRSSDGGWQLWARAVQLPSLD